MKGWRRDLAAVARPALFTALWRAAILLVIALLNPFEVNQWSGERTLEMWQRLHAPYYQGAAGNPNDTRDEITVVMVDNDVTAAAQQGRALDSFDILQMIEDVARPSTGGQARAVFVDLMLSEGAPAGLSDTQLLTISEAQKQACLYRDAADTSLSPFRCLLIGIAQLTAYDQWRDKPACLASTVAKLRCIVRFGGVPILIADERDPKTKTPTESPALAALDTVAVTVPVMVNVQGYPLAWMPREGTVPRALSPAAALYSIWCLERDTRCPPPFNPTHPVAGWNDAFARDVTVVWGTGRPSAFTGMQQRLSGDPLDKTCGVLQANQLQSARMFLRLFTKGFHGDADRAPCSYTNILPYGDLQKLTADEMRLVLRDRFVMIGAALPDSNDFVPAPFEQMVPGVVLHAMAADNLLRYGPRYAAVDKPLFGWLDLTAGDLISVAASFLLAFVLAVAAYLFERYDARVERRKKRPHWTIRAAIILGIALVAWWLLVAAVTDSWAPPVYDMVPLTIIVILGLWDLARIAARPFYTPIHDRFTIAAALTSA